MVFDYNKQYLSAKQRKDARKKLPFKRFYFLLFWKKENLISITIILYEFISI